MASAPGDDDGTSGRERHMSNSSSRPRSKRYTTALFSMATEQDQEVEDELARSQRRLRDLKSKISRQSKRNFLLERDVRYLDSRIALLIQNRMALEDQQEFANQLEEVDAEEGSFPDDRKKQAYGALFFLLQSEPRHIATLCRLVTLAEIDTLLQTVMFTLYGNQYESREEHLLLSMFQSVLSAQFETSAEFGSLLRANTPVSRMMTTYTRRGPGQSYLKTVLSGRINSLIEHKDLNLEINPLKVYEQLVADKEEAAAAVGESTDPDAANGLTPEEAAEDPQVHAIIGPRLVMLVEIANSFLSTIIASIDLVPYGIRWICKQIRSLTKRKYPDANEYSVCSLIGGFFMLRFINPAIVTPQAYMLVEANPSKHPRRTLTLIAKMLQNLANKPSYSKETYMQSLEAFVEQNKERILTFLNQLCEVGDFFESLEMDQYVALTKKEIELNITLNEVYNSHALLFQHRDVMAPSPNSHLRQLLNELGPPPAQVSRRENKTFVLPLIARWEVPISEEMSSQGDDVTQADLLYMETKSIFVQIIRSMPNLFVTSPKSEPVLRLPLPEIAEAAATSKDSLLVRKGIKVKEMLRELTVIGVVSARDSYALMTNEVAKELAHLGNLRETVKQEVSSLEAVYKTICDHNNYLRSQLESYKAYLQNVRQSSAAGSAGSIDKSSPSSGSAPGGGFTNLGANVAHLLQGSKSRKPGQVLGPFKFSHFQLEKDGVVVDSNVPANRRPNVFFNISSPSPGTFIIALLYKGREKAILEMDLKLDDLLEKQQENVQLLDLEYVQLHVTRTLNLLTRTFIKK